MKPTCLAACLLVLTTTAGCGDDDGDVQTESAVLSNHGGDMEGHTPRGFMGMGTGLFVGDNLNAGFPEGDGVQLFLTFDLAPLSASTILSAELRSSHASTAGTPFTDLGELTAEEIRYDSFSSALWDLAPEAGGGSCVFATSAAGPFSCDIADIVQRSIDDGYGYVQLRMRLTEAGDSDGQADLVRFFIADVNTNEPGIFELDVEGAQ